jgi:hypothetical protein
VNVDLRNDRAACDRRDLVLADEWRRLDDALRGDVLPTREEAGRAAAGRGGGDQVACPVLRAGTWPTRDGAVRCG